MSQVGQNLQAKFRTPAAVVLLVWSCAPAQAQAVGADEPRTADAPATSQPVRAAELRPSRGADADIGLLDLDIPTVVTATRREQRANTLPYALSVVTAEDIRRSGARSVTDALRLVPGVDVAELSAGISAVSPRGFNAFYANKTLVLVDGRQIYDGEFGGTIWGNWPFMLEDIARIEVIRGPGGVTWGANAVNGVINIITKDPREQQGVTISGGGGSRGAQREYAGYAFDDGKLRMRVSGEYEGNDGFGRGGSWLRPLDDDYQAGRFNVYGVYDAGPADRFSFSVGSGIVDKGWTPSFFSAQSTQRPGTQANFVTGRWSHKLDGDGTLDVSGYVNDFALDQGTKSTDTRYQQYGLSVSTTVKPNEQHTLTWGVDGRADWFDASNCDPKLLADKYVGNGLIGAYAQDEWRFAPRWALNLGGRLDYDFWGGFQPSARAALSYEVAKDSLLWAAVSRGYQMPTGPLRLLDAPLFGGIGRVVADRDLDPVQLLAYEFGYRARPIEHLDVAASAFWHEYDEFYGTAFHPGLPGAFHERVEDIGAASLYGVEVEGRYRVTEWLRLLGNYTYQSVNWRSDQSFTTGLDTTVPPKSKFMIGAQIDPMKDLHLSSYLYWVGATHSPNPDLPFLARHVDDYFRLDLRAEYEFCEHRAALAVGVRNLLDPYHFESASAEFAAAEVPRVVYAELRIHFK